MNSDPLLAHPYDYRLIARLGAWSCIIFIIYSILTILIVGMIGGPPASAAETFSILQQNRLAGLLRLDILTVFVMPLYYVLFYSLWKVMRPVENGLITISVILIFAGVTLFLAAPSTFSYLHLSDAYHAAANEIEKNTLLAAGQAVYSTDIWHGAGPQIGGILVQTGALIISILMLRGSIFTKLTAFIGILMHGLDLLHMLIGFFSTSTANLLMFVAGPLYPVWFLLLGLRLFKLSRA